MEFNKHFDLEGKHAFLSASKHHWTNYNEDKLVDAYRNHRAKEEGTEMHMIAALLIQKRLKQAHMKKAFNMHVNDAIGYYMQPEQVLYYSDNCFGTADAISFRDNLLRVHDLKTGVTKVSFKQLDVYNALFCLEYDVSPHDILIENRIYQGRDKIIDIPEPERIQSIMDKIVQSDKIIEQIKLEGW